MAAVTDTAMRVAAITAERHDLAAVLRHRVRLCAHRLLIRSSDGWERAVALEPKSGPQFYAEVMAARRELDRDQRGTLGSRRRPGTSSSARRCRRRPTSPGGTQIRRFAVHIVGIFRLPGASILRSPTPHRVSRGWRSG